MTGFGALWVLEQERKAWKYATNPDHDVHMVDPFTDPNVSDEKKQYLWNGAVLAGLSQSTFLTMAGHKTLMDKTAWVQRYAQFPNKWVQPPPGSPWWSIPKIVPKGKWALRGAKLGARVLPGVQLGLVAWDIYSVGKYIDLW